MIKKITLVSVLALILTGCGSDGSSSSPRYKVDEISQLEGFWNTSYEKEGKQDTIYEYFLSNGEIVIYDYQKDSRDNGSDCYVIGKSIYEIRKDVAGIFHFYNTKEEKIGLQFDAEISKDELTLINPFNPDEIIIYPKVSKNIADIEAKECIQNAVHSLEKKRQ